MRVGRIAVPGRAAAVTVAERRVETDLPRSVRTLEVFVADKAGTGKERRAEDRRIELGTRCLRGEQPLVGVTHRERQDQTVVVVVAAGGDVVVRGNGQVRRSGGGTNSVPAGREGDAEFGVVERLEVLAFLAQDVANACAVLRIIRAVGRRHVIDAGHQEDDILRASRIVPPEEAVIDQDTERVQTADVVGRVPFPRDEMHVALRSRNEPLQRRSIDVGDFVALRHEGVGRPVGRVGGIVRLIHQRDALGLLAAAVAVEEPSAGGVAAPWIGGGLGAGHHARDLQAGVEDVLVRRAARPEATARRAGAGRVHANLAFISDAHEHAVDVDPLQGLGEQLVRLLRARKWQRCCGCRDKSNQAGRQAQSGQKLLQTTVCEH